MKPINDLLATHGVPVYDPDDATLSSGEHAQAIIVAAPLLAAAESSMCPDVEGTDLQVAISRCFR